MPGPQKRYYMSEFLTAPKPYEREPNDLDHIRRRFETVADVLGFEESGDAAEARGDLIRWVDVDGRFDENNLEHTALLDAYQLAAEAGFANDPEPEPAIGYQIALAILWIRLDDPDRFYDRIDSALDMLYKTHDPILVEVNAIVEDLESLNTNTQ